MDCDCQACREKNSRSSFVEDFLMKYNRIRCVNCGGYADITRLMNLSSQEDVKLYIAYCEKLHEAPKMLCCACFDVADKAPSFMVFFKCMLENFRQTYELKCSLTREINRFQDKTEQLDSLRLLHSASELELIEKRKQFEDEYNHLIRLKYIYENDPIKVLLNMRVSGELNDKLKICDCGGVARVI